MWLFYFSKSLTKFNLVHSSLKNIRTSHFSIILSVGADIFHEDKRTYMTTVKVTFYNSFQMCFKLDSSASQHLPVTFWIGYKSKDTFTPMGFRILYLMSISGSSCGLFRSYIWQALFIKTFSKSTIPFDKYG
jgi:hypothetical protein